MSELRLHRGAIASFGPCLLLAACLPLVACLSSAPPAPPVRWFDPLPTPSANGPSTRSSLRLRVQAPPFLGRELALRTGVREYAFDADHQWVATPAELVAQALHGAIAFVDAGADELRVEVERFELDLTLTAAPRAVVRLSLARGAVGAAAGVAEASAPAADASPPALAAAMAKALGDVVERVREQVAVR